MGLIAYIIDVVFGLIELGLVFRVFLKIFNANAAAPFVHFIYVNTDKLIEPFVGIFSFPPYLTQFNIETSTLIAILVYGIIGSLLQSIAYSLRPRSNTV